MVVVEKKVLDGITLALRCFRLEMILFSLAQEIHVVIPYLMGGQGQSPCPWKEGEGESWGAIHWLGDTFPQGTGLHGVEGAGGAPG